MATHSRLRRELHWYQIFFIILSAVIGTGVLSNALIIEISGPSGLLISVGVFGLITICVGETISELVQLFPIPNAIVNYVYFFVDPELSWIIGFVYWYAYATICSYQIGIAAEATVLWGLHEDVARKALYTVAPLVFLVINVVGGVRVFGWLETVGGAIKVVFLFGLATALLAASGPGQTTDFIEDEFQSNTAYADNPAVASLVSFPLAAFGFVGIEVAAVAAYEARSTKDIQLASKYIHYVISSLYLFCAFALCTTVDWNDPSLPDKDQGLFTRDTEQASSLDFSCTNTTFNNTGDTLISSLLSTCSKEGQDGLDYKSLILVIRIFRFYSSLSAGSTAFYIASRTLHGLTYRMEGTPVIRLIKGLGSHVTSKGVPVPAILVTCITTVWITAIGPKKDRNVMPFVSVTSSMACLVVWLVICVAFLRFYYWQRICRKTLREGNEVYRKFERGSDRFDKEVDTLLSSAQPILALIGAAGCIAVFIFASALWWQKPASVIEVVALYGVQIFVLVAWATLKLLTGKWKNRWWVEVRRDNLRGALYKLMLAEALDERPSTPENGDNYEMEDRGER